MEVILLEDVEKVGLKGDVVNVARGYARNFLLPRRLAQEATSARVAELRKREAQRARHEAQTFDQAREIATGLEQTVLRFDVKAGPTGALFGSVTATDIVDELWKTKKIRVDRRKVQTDPIKRIGRYAVPIELFTDVTVELETHVVPEGGELPEAEPTESTPEAEASTESMPEPPVRDSGPVAGALGGGVGVGGAGAGASVRDSGPGEGAPGEPGGSPGGEPRTAPSSANPTS